MLQWQLGQLMINRIVESERADVLILGTYFPSPSMGHIVPHGSAFQFAYEQEAD